MSPDVSLVIPLFNEEECVPALLTELRSFISHFGRSAEVILVELLGAHAHLHLDAGGRRLIAVVPGGKAPPKGSAVHVRLDPARAHRFDGAGTRMDG